MSEIVRDLEERLWLAELWLHEKWEMVGVNLDGRSIPDVLTEQESKAIKILASLREAMPALPVSLAARTEELRKAAPHIFEKVACSLADAVGFNYFPASAADFVQLLNDNIERIASHGRVSASA